MRQTLLVVAAALAAFGLTAGGSFHFDDYSLFSDPAIASPQGWSEIWQPLQTRPLTWFTFWFNYQLGGANPLGFHLVNLMLHVGVSALLPIVLRRLLPPSVALAAALLFAVHPMQTQAVAYVFARGTLLSTLLCLVSLWFWLKGRVWGAVGCFGAALLAKEECAAFPVFLLALGAAGVYPAHKRACTAMLGLSVAAGLRVIHAASLIRGAGVASGAGISPVEYLSYQGIAIVRYLAMLIVPWGYSVDPDIAAPIGWRIAAWAAVGALAIAALRWRRAGFWFIAGCILLAPSSSFFPAADLAADRRMYLPMIAFSAGLASILNQWRREALAVSLIALTALSVRQSVMWSSERRLWSEAAARAPRKVRPKIQLSRALEPASALPVLDEAQSIAPADPEVASERGRVYLELGRPAEALSTFGRALALAPGNANAMNNRGVALHAFGQVDAAKADFERALNLDPCLFDARLNLLKLGGRAPPAGCRFTPQQAAQLRDR